MNNVRLSAHADMSEVRVEKNGPSSILISFRTVDYSVGIQLVNLLLKYPLVSYAIFDFSRDIYTLSNECILRFDTFPPMTTATVLKTLLADTIDKSTDVCILIQKIIHKSPF
ncbi:uncharacterized protein LOC119689294 [Teleopsis dalmanni]|uniref:uncharacterized protein LOC119689294 n=1 Tax=Teleopsis dalmanni TaxID=139649 RepID=UPI0018CF06B6|nr:uncharacterized protein LOC119689294 [Teleopsis dalmanni]